MMRLTQLLFLLFIVSTVHSQPRNSFSFVVAADMRKYTGVETKHFRGVCESLKTHEDISFLISPGDIDPPDSVYYTIQKYWDPNMVWYPVVGNHEAETPSDMVWLRNFNKGGNSLPGIVNSGPASCLETNYSFDHKNTHFVILNQYCNDTCDDCTSGDINDFLYNWLKDDLQKTRKRNIIVLGHEPAYPLPDIENQRFRHQGDCLNQYPENRDRFVKLLQDHEVRAYIFGHTHNYSVAKINDLWHVDVGHSRGIGDMGARSTYIIINVSRKHVTYETYRLDYDSNSYKFADKGVLN